ncbi:calcium-binding protein [Asticcacaulis biprosthecium]|nr:calcium-binding protein [Asticcacaulis biprosthecium]
MALYNGNNSDNLITGSVLADQIYGRGGNDVLDGGDGNDLIDGGNDHDVLYGGAGHDSLYGGSGNDNLIGGAGDDQLYGGQGQDWATYTGGAAIVANLNTGLVTGQGSDTLNGIENIMGSDFADILQGNASANKLHGGGGDDRFVVSYGYDELVGGTGTDVLDFINAGPVQVSLLQGTYYMNNNNAGTATGFEDILGGNSNDLLRGDNGANRIDGRGGQDTLDGQGGADVLTASGGHDSLTGGAGNDSFVIAASSGNIVISDFTQGSDVIDLSHYFDQNGQSAVWSASAAQQGANTVLTLTGAAQTVTVTLNNVVRANLTAADFVNPAPTLPAPVYVPTGDVFVATPVSGGGAQSLVIGQFDDGLDLIDLSAFGYVYDSGLNDYVATVWYDNGLRQAGGDVVTTFHDGSGATFTLVIGNTQLSQIDLGDFIF